MRRSTKREIRIFLASVVITTVIVLSLLFFYFEGPLQDQSVGKTITEIWGGKK